MCRVLSDQCVTPVCILCRFSALVFADLTSWIGIWWIWKSLKNDVLYSVGCQRWWQKRSLCFYWTVIQLHLETLNLEIVYNQKSEIVNSIFQDHMISWEGILGETSETKCLIMWNITEKPLWAKNVPLGYRVETEGQVYSFLLLHKATQFETCSDQFMSCR